MRPALMEAVSEPEARMRGSALARTPYAPSLGIFHSRLAVAIADVALDGGEARRLIAQAVAACQRPRVSTSRRSTDLNSLLDATASVIFSASSGRNNCATPNWHALSDASR